MAHEESVDEGREGGWLNVQVLLTDVFYEELTASSGIDCAGKKVAKINQARARAKEQVRKANERVKKARNQLTKAKADSRLIWRSKP